VLHRPVPKERAAFLSLSSDVAAVVYIDDLRVKKKTPLVRYPVEPGLRHILLETATGERKAFDVELQKGQLKKLDERFKAPRGR
jgi:serine/threonine-protein kinase